MRIYLYEEERWELKKKKKALEEEIGESGVYLLSLSVFYAKPL